MDRDGPPQDLRPPKWPHVTGSPPLASSLKRGGCLSPDLLAWFVYVSYPTGEAMVSIMLLRTELLNHHFTPPEPPDRTLSLSHHQATPPHPSEPPDPPDLRPFVLLFFSVSALTLPSVMLANVTELHGTDLTRFTTRRLHLLLRRATWYISVIQRSFLHLGIFPFVELVLLPVSGFASYWSVVYR
ncbi:unnamed protein product [Microthlaspi erraticum]|uniref:Uncharacterized protein n=1 Tax=Microthlaspi erraticum TaxID=1685480 RepID=A0A6D2KNB6_9BRAS|nr:unnamed protein product [Microthlaspi erraticum]